jgi:hypothetical protein
MQANCCCKAEEEWRPLVNPGSTQSRLYTHCSSWGRFKTKKGTLALSKSKTRVIAYTFLGEAPCGDSRLLHLDGNSHHNCILNLRWSTALPTPVEETPGKVCVCAYVRKACLKMLNCVSTVKKKPRVYYDDLSLEAPTLILLEKLRDTNTYVTTEGEEWRPLQWPGLTIEVEDKYKGWRWCSSKGRFLTVQGRFYENDKNQCRPSIYVPVKGEHGGALYKQIDMHRILAYTFFGPPPTENSTVDHIDRDPSNNSIQNLRWASPLEQFSNRERMRFLVRIGEREVHCLDDAARLLNMSKVDVRVFLQKLDFKSSTTVTLGDAQEAQAAVKVQVQLLWRNFETMNNPESMDRIGGKQKELKELTYVKVYDSFCSGRTVEECAEEFNIEPCTVRGYIWKAVASLPIDDLYPFLSRVGLPCEEESDLVVLVRQSELYLTTTDPVHEERRQICKELRKTLDKDVYEQVRDKRYKDDVKFCKKTLQVCFPVCLSESQEVVLMKVMSVLCKRLMQVVKKVVGDVLNTVITVVDNVQYIQNAIP